MQQIEAGTASVASAREGLIDALDKISKEACDEETRNEACSHGAVEGIGSTLVWCLSDLDLCEHALATLSNLLEAALCRESVSQKLVNAIVAAMGQHDQLVVPGLTTLSAA